MNVLIICTNQNVLPMPVMPIGACMVAEAAEGAGHRVSVLDLMFERDPVHALTSALRRSKPDVIGLSVRNIDNNDMRGPAFYIPGLLPLIKTIRSSTEAPIILGGAALTVMPEEILRLTGISLAVIGDGEVTFPLLLERLSRGEPFEDLPGIASLADGEFRANPPASTGTSSDCMTPDYHRWIDIRSYRSQLSTAPLQTKLGCQFHCSYCTYRKIEGSTYRFSDPRQVAESAARLASSGLPDIEFVDSVFNAPYGHAMAVCEALARSMPAARFQSLELNPLYFDDALLTAMEQAGFVGIGLTVESASDEVLQGLRKGFTARHVYAAAEIVKQVADSPPDTSSQIDVHHNFVNEEEHLGRKIWVHRKGAIATPSGARVLIPGSMGTASYVAEGLGEATSFRSASHGAGRVMTRREARERISTDRLAHAMRRVVHDERRARALVEEAPAAYRDIGQVLEDEDDLVRPVLRLEPLVVLKG